MKYSKEEIMQYMLEEDVKFIRLAFCDAFGKQKNISIMPEELPRAFEYGIAQQLAQIVEITTNKEKPTFENTVLALENSGEVEGK